MVRPFRTETSAKLSAGALPPESPPTLVSEPRDRLAQPSDGKTPAEDVASFTILTEIEVQAAESQGVIFAQHGQLGGHSLFLKRGKLYYSHNLVGVHEQKFVSNVVLPEGTHVLGIEFTTTREISPVFVGGRLRLSVDSQVVAKGQMLAPCTCLSLWGKDLTIGQDRGSPISAEYRPPFPLVGVQVRHVEARTTGPRIEEPPWINP